MHITEAVARLCHRLEQAVVLLGSSFVGERHRLCRTRPRTRPREQHTSRRDGNRRCAKTNHVGTSLAMMSLGKLLLVAVAGLEVGWESALNRLCHFRRVIGEDALGGLEEWESYVGGEKRKREKVVWLKRCWEEVR